VVDPQCSENWCRTALALLLQATGLQRSPGAGAPPAGLPTRRLLLPERVGHSTRWVMAFQRKGIKGRIYDP
jgi:hypothetical protein